MTGWGPALSRAAADLRAAGIPDPMRDARLLLAHALGVAPERLTLHLHDAADPKAAARFDDLIAARRQRRPLSHLTGRRLFWGRSFRVTPDVLDPRPETETLVALVLAAPFASVLDLGTGSGAIVLSLLADRPQARGTGTDISAAALAVARSNAAALGVDDRVDLILSDWWAQVTGRFDLVVSNPPYIAAAEMAALSPEVRDHEPHLALTPGGDGLDAYRAIAAQAPLHLAPGGRILVEIGPTQGPAVAALFADAGLHDIRLNPDMDGRDRVVAARKP